MKRQTLLPAVLALLVSLLLGACTETATKGENPTPDTRAADRQEINLSLAMEPTTLDSTMADSPEAFVILGNVMEGLVRQGPGGTLVPGVAVEWSVEDGVHYTFRLRSNARWSDGQPVTAADFQYAWLRALDPKTAGDYAYQLYDIRGAEAFHTLSPRDPSFAEKHPSLREKVAIEAPDEHTLRVTLERPTPHWAGLTAFPTYFPLRQDVVDKHGETYGLDTATLICNGPYALAEWDHERRIVLKRNSEYWDAAAVKLEQATFAILPDAEEPARRFDAGELDFATLTAQGLTRYQQNRSIGHVAEAATWYVVANTQEGALKELSLRKALSLAIDRKSFTETVLAGAVLPAEGLVPPSISGADGKSYRELAGVLIDTDSGRTEARQFWSAYLQEHGLTELKLRLASLNTPSAKRYARGLQERWQAALPGLTIDLEYMDQKTMLDRLGNSDFDLAFSGSGADYNDPMTFLELWLSESPFNDAGWTNSAYDAAIRKAGREQSAPERLKALAEAEAILLRELPVIPLYHPTVWWIARPTLKGLQTHPVGPFVDLKQTYVEGQQPQK